MVKEVNGIYVEWDSDKNDINKKKHRQQPTEEQRREIREAAKRPPVYDADAPELSIEQMERYRKAAIRKKAQLCFDCRTVSDGESESCHPSGIFL